MINIDIVPIEEYRGADRLFRAEFPKLKKGKLELLIEGYFKYIDLYEKCTDNIEFFENVLPYYNMLIENKVDVEIIIFDDKPIKEFNDQKLTFLGIDVLNQFGESAVRCDEDKLKNLLNNKLLLENKNDAHLLLNEVKDFYPAAHNWEFYYIYKIEC